MQIIKLIDCKDDSVKDQALKLLWPWNSNMKPTRMLQREIITCRFVSFLSCIKSEILFSLCLHVESNNYLPQNNKDSTNNKNSESIPARKQNKAKADD